MLSHETNLGNSARQKEDNLSLLTNRQIHNLIPRMISNESWSEMLEELSDTFLPENFRRQILAYRLYKVKFMIEKMRIHFPKQGLTAPE